MFFFICRGIQTFSTSQNHLEKKKLIPVGEDPYEFRSKGKEDTESTRSVLITVNVDQDISKISGVPVEHIKGILNELEINSSALILEVHF